MTKLTMLLKHAVLVLCFVFLAQDAAAYEATNSATKSKKNTTKANNNAPASGAKPIPVERDFDKLRGFQSYDPATDKWSQIEDFETVDILEDTTEQRQDQYVYHSFWAYDAPTNSWHKVDIRDYGYKLGTAKTETPEAAPPKSFGFWKNFALGLRVGGGPSFYENIISHCSIIERDGDFFLQTTKGEEDPQISYKINWFRAAYKKCGDPQDSTQGQLKIRRQKAVGNQKIVFKGTGFSIPITLDMEYTLFKRFILGAGCMLEINHLKKLETPTPDPLSIQLDHAWFYNTAWFGRIGFKVFHGPHQDIIVDLQAGKNYNAGVTFKNINPFGGKGYLDNGWLLGAGVTYERKLNHYFSWLTRLSGDWKTHNATPPNIDNPQTLVKLNQVTVCLELGVHVRFGKDTKEEEESKEELDADQVIQPQQKTALQTRKPKRKQTRPAVKQRKRAAQVLGSKLR